MAYPGALLPNGSIEGQHYLIVSAPPSACTIHITYPVFNANHVSLSDSTARYRGINSSNTRKRPGSTAFHKSPIPLERQQ